MYALMQEVEKRLAMVCGMMLILADTDNLSFPGWAAVTLTFSFHSTNIASWVSWRDREKHAANAEHGIMGVQVAMYACSRQPPSTGGRIMAGAQEGHAVDMPIPVSSSGFWKRTPAIAPGESSVQQRSASELGSARP